MGELVYRPFEQRRRTRKAGGFVGYGDVIYDTKKKSPTELGAQRFSAQLKVLTDLGETDRKNVSDRWSHYESFEYLNPKLMAIIYIFADDHRDKDISLDDFKGSALDKYIIKLLPSDYSLKSLDPLMKQKIQADIFKYYNWYVKVTTTD